MWTERDQIQAYQFLRRRLVSALTVADANHPVAPNRRLVFGVVLGGVATLLTAAGFGISGLLQPSPPPDWKHTGLVILDKDGGGHFVLDKDGVLHPVANLASARLLANSTKTVTVAASLLRGAPRGEALGIPAAPDTLPDPAGLLADPIPVACSRATSDLPKVTGPVAALLLAHAGDPTATLTGMVGVPEGHGLLAQNPKGDRFLITGGVKYKLGDRPALIALGYQNAATLAVTDSWLATLPSGRDLNLVAVPDAGKPGPRVGDLRTKVGQILAADNAVAGRSGYYLVRANGLEPVSQAQAALILAATANAPAYAGDGMPVAKPVSVADAAAAPSVPPGDDASGYPAGVPTPVAVGGDSTVVCAVGDGKDPSAVALGTAWPLPPGARTVPTGAPQNGAAADEVYLSPGSAALVTAKVAQGAPADKWYLVTDAGTKYALGDTQARGSLGYGNAVAEQLPPTAVGMLPTGPVLDEADAQKPVAVPGG
ncbi:type VII secretion protein EccB [Catenulispora subtropica]|uniref:Type VII secretion protein EccB n=1 Tax=Catenulispora subtropica TaxID=450798 RepID=A0ABN2S8Q5_9ACTN